MAKKKSHLSKIFISLLVAIPSFMNVVRHTFSLISKEAHVAGKSLICLTILVVLLAVVCVSIWTCMLFLLFFYFLMLHWSVESSVFIILLLNVIFLIFILFSMKKYKKNLTFPKTRKRFRDLSD